MGGRGGSSGLGKETGFSFRMNGKTTTVQKTKTGVVLVNGTPQKNVNYEKLLSSAKSKEGFTTLSAAQIAKNRSDRSKNYNAHDYELMYDTRGKRKSVYRPRKNSW